MRLLTDAPSATRDFLPPGASWQSCATHALDEADACLWKVFGNGAPCFYCDVEDVAYGSDPARRVVLIEFAPTSQFAQAQAAMKSQAKWPSNWTCLALEGSQFQGQRGRAWMALRGNLHLTCQYEIGLPADQVQAGLTALPAVAAVQAIRAASSLQAEPSIKWVNDVLLDGRKVAGVLTASRLEGAILSTALFGIGINLAQAPDLPRQPFAPEPGSLAALNVELSRMWQHLQIQLDEGVRRLREEGEGALVNAYEASADFIGRKVQIWPEEYEGATQPEALLTGRVRGLAPDLSLLIDGGDDPVRKGRMTYT